jgi:hypothetical protein
LARIQKTPKELIVALAGKITSTMNVDMTKKMKTIAVIDFRIAGLFIYNVPDTHHTDEIEAFIELKGHPLGNCSWGVFEGDIQDNRK